MAKPKTQIVVQDLDLKLDGKEVKFSASTVGVVNDLGQVVFTLSVLPDGSLQVKAGGLASRDRIALDNRLHIIPETSDRVVLFRPLAVEPS